MRTKTLVLALGTVVLAAVPFVSESWRRPRSAGPVALASIDSASSTFVWADAAALFVGVRKFRSDEILEVPYAVDDAIDLAHRFVMDARLRLVPPHRTVLAIEGDPQKAESAQRLIELRKAGVRVRRADRLLELLDAQAGAAGANGILIVSFATHGFTASDGQGYVLGAESVFRYPETALALDRIFEITGRSAARRSLILIDACRDRALTGARTGSADPDTAAPLLHKRMRNVKGEVILYAAARGDYAWDDDVSRNGVFTRAVLEALDCRAPKSGDFVTAAGMHAYVERTVREWRKRNDKPVGEAVTQASYEGSSEAMPLVNCRKFAAPIAGNPFSAIVEGSVVTVRDVDRKPLWRRELDGVLDTAVADLDADGAREVVIGFSDGRLRTLGRDGKLLSETRSGSGIAMPLRRLYAGPLFWREDEESIVALWTDPAARASRVVILGAGDSLKAAWDHPAAISQLEVGRPTDRSGMKIALGSADTLFLFHPKHLGSGKPEWSFRTTSGTGIQSVAITDADGDQRREIAVKTAAGTTYFTFDGDILPNSTPRAEWRKIRPSRGATTAR